MGEGEYTVRTSSVQVDMTSARILAADPRRVAVIFSGDGGFSTGAVEPVGWSATPSRIFTPAGGYIEFTFSKHGPLPAGPWNGINPVGSSLVFITEILTVDSAVSKKESVQGGLSGKYEVDEAQSIGTANRDRRDDG